MKTWMTTALGITLLALTSGCGLPKHVIKTARINEPPPGQALINFQRPSTWGGDFYPIFDGDGKFICDMPGGSEFQYVCSPGKHLFMGWADQVSVVDAEVAADRTYDIMVDIGMGWVKANIKLHPMTKGDPRRPRLAEFEKRARLVVGLQRTEHVDDYERKNQSRVEDIKRDFLGGAKQERVQVLRPDDCR